MQCLREESTSVGGQPLLCSSSGLYQISRLLGSGSYGHVVECRKQESGEVVAIKILKSDPLHAKLETVEADILRRLTIEHADLSNIVQSYGSFVHDNRLCLVFEMLQESLLDFMENRHFAPLELQSIQMVVQQVAAALVKLKSLGLIHADLKPDNIMMVDTLRQPYRVKVIDFGLAQYASEAQCGAHVQTRYYRAPEIILGLPFSEAIDMWSLGCTMAELFLGRPLYPGASEYDQIRRICVTQGLPAEGLLNAGTKTTRYFIRASGTDYFRWRLKTRAEFGPESGVTDPHQRENILHYLLKVNIGNLTCVELLDEMKEMLIFADLLQRMLDLEAESRITPAESLQHPFMMTTHPVAHISSCESSEVQSSEVQSPEVQRTSPGSVHSCDAEVQQSESSSCDFIPPTSSQAPPPSVPSCHVGPLAPPTRHLFTDVLQRAPRYQPIKCLPFQQRGLNMYP